MNRQNNQSNQGNYRIVPNGNGDLVRVPNGQHPAMDPNIVINDNDDFVRDPTGRDATFQIFIKDTEGVSQTFDVKSSYTVDQLMDMVQQKMYIAKDQQRLLYGGKQLEKERRLSEYNIQKHSALNLVLRVRGG